MGNNITREQAFGRWIKGEPVEFQFGSERWVTLQSSASPGALFWREARFRATPQSFLEALKAARDMARGGPRRAVQIVRDGRMPLTVWANGVVGGSIILDDFDATDWRVSENS